MRGASPTLTRRDFIGRLPAGCAALALATRLRGAHEVARRGKWRIGHHFWNWDHAWNQGEFLERRLRLTRETGYEGFEAKPRELTLNL